MTNNPFKTIADLYDESVKQSDDIGLAEVYKQATQMVFKSIKEEANKYCRLNLTITDIKYLDGYYIFGTGTNSVVHFHIKETPGWKYGIWWTPIIEETSVSKDKVRCSIFTQYEEEIDKFKPSASSVQDDFNVNIKEPDSFSVWNFVKNIRFIYKEPELAFYREMHYSDFNTEYVSRAEAKAYYKHTQRQNKLEAKVIKQNNKALLKTIYKIFKEDFDEGNCFIEDRGDNWSPRYEIIMKNSFGVDDGHYSCLDEKEEKLYNKTVEKCNKRADKINYYWSPCCSDSAVLLSEDKFNERYTKATKVDIKTLGE